MYDAIVIGARCAGAATAMLLARNGHRVLLLDRAAFPSDVHQGHFIHRHGPKRLADWGLLEKVVATNCPAITTHLPGFGDCRLVGSIRVGNLAWAYGPRRRQLDQVVVQAAIDVGARFDPMPAKLPQLRAALRGNEEDTRRFIMAREGMIPPEEFFNPENLERILVNAQAGSGSPERSSFLPELNQFRETADNV